MHFPTITGFIAATMITAVVADFQIYYISPPGLYSVEDQDISWQWEEENIVSPTGDTNTISNIRMFDGEPSCDDVNGYASLGVAGDASSAGYARCEGCGDYGDILNWDITELEMNGQNDWGHYTIYKDGGFQLTPADGGPLRGTCTRDNGDDYLCTTALDLSKGNRLFTCTSDLAGLHAR